MLVPDGDLPLMRLDAGASFGLAFSAEAIRDLKSLDLIEGGDILLHIKPRPDKGQMVINDHRGGAWGKPVTLAHDGTGPALLRLRFDFGGAHLAGDGTAEVTFARFDGLGRELHARVPGGVMLTRERPWAGSGPGCLAPLSASADGPQVLALALATGKAMTAATAALLRRAGLAGLCVPVGFPAAAIPEDAGLALLPLWTSGQDAWMRGRLPVSESGDLGAVIAALADGRALRLAGRPVLVVADRNLAAEGAASLRRTLAEALGQDPMLLLAAPATQADTCPEGYDGALELPTGSASLPEAPRQALAADLARRQRLWPTVAMLRAGMSGLEHDGPDGMDQLAEWLRAKARRAALAPAPGHGLLILDCLDAGGAGLASAGDDGKAFLSAAARALAQHPDLPLHRVALLVPPDAAAAKTVRQAGALLRAHFGAAPVYLDAAEGGAPPPQGNDPVLPVAQARFALQQLGISRIATFGQPLPAPLQGFTARRFSLSPDGLANGCAGLLDWACPARQRISVVVPTWQSAEWLETRLGSILAQTESVHEVILLDDASTDGTIAGAERIADRTGRQIRVVPCAVNSGNVTHQWRRACELATGDLLWIAEADDSAEPRFLEVLAALMRRDPWCVLAFCDSAEMGQNGEMVAADRKPYYAAMGDLGLMRSASFDTREFAQRFLAPRNLVLTSSAVLWRRAHLARAFATLGDKALSLHYAGDWQLYLQACDAPGTVQYCADPLARQRRHSGSVIGSARPLQHFAEVQRLHDDIRDRFPGDAEILARLARHQSDLRRIWRLDAAENPG